VARVAEGWKLVWRGDVAHVRFRIKGARRIVSTGERNAVLAAQVAARLYAEALGSGSRRQQLTGLPSQHRLEELLAQWREDLSATHDAGTTDQYLHVARAQWIPRWMRLGEITTAAIADYQRDRLREVTRETTRKHIVALRTFLNWCVERGALGEVPIIPLLHERSTGVRARKIALREPMTPAEAARLIAALPILSSSERRSSAQVYRVRDWAVVAWETALRPTTLAQLTVPDHWRPKRDTIEIADEIDKIRFGREVPITPQAVRALARSAPTAGLIFGEHDYDPYLEEAGERVLGRKVHAYDFRHSRITSWVRSGADLLGVQFLAGHKDLSTTAKYAHPSAAAARRALKAAR